MYINTTIVVIQLLICRLNICDHRRIYTRILIVCRRTEFLDAMKKLGNHHLLGVRNNSNLFLLSNVNAMHTFKERKCYFNASSKPNLR